MKLNTLSVATLALMASTVAVLAEPIDPAQVIAQKFSEASDAKATAVPDRPGLDYEMDMLDRARAEELERQNADAQKKMIVKAVAPIAAQPVATPVVAPVAVPAAASPIVTPVAAPPAAAPLAVTPVTSSPSTPAVSVETLPEAPTPGVRQAQTASPPPAAASPPAPSPSTTSPSQPTNGSHPEARATILLVLDSDGDDAAAKIKPDPIVCFDQTCWISNGLEAAAKSMPRSEALALKSTDAVTADSCNRKSACAFRNIAVGANAQIQVVEVGESRGVAGSAYTVTPDSSCRKDDDELICDNGLATQSFRLWVVPEATAQATGPAGLEDAIAGGLTNDDDDQPVTEDGK
jgi:hypothetical protein